MKEEKVERQETFKEYLKGNKLEFFVMIGSIVMMFVFFNFVYNIFQILKRFDKPNRTPEQAINSTIYKCAELLRMKQSENSLIEDLLTNVQQMSQNESFWDTIGNSSLTYAFLPAIVSSMVSKSLKCDDFIVQHQIEVHLKTLLSLIPVLKFESSSVNINQVLKTIKNCNGIDSSYINVFDALSIHTDKTYQNLMIKHVSKQCRSFSDPSDFDWCLRIFHLPGVRSLVTNNHEEYCSFVDYLVEGIDSWADETRSLFCRISKFAQCPSYNHIDLDRICPSQDL